MFGALAGAEGVGIEDYTLCQTSLDQVRQIPSPARVTGLMGDWWGQVFLHFAEEHYQGLADADKHAPAAQPQTQSHRPEPVPQDPVNV